MKKQKSNVVALALTFCLIIACMFTLTACRTDEQVHAHTYSDAWTYNETHHWKEATCSHADEKGEYAEHSFTNNVCACGYVTVTYTVADATAWNEVFTGSQMDNVTCVADNNSYQNDVIMENEANSSNMKITENAIIQINSAHGQSQATYVVKQNNVWYRVSKNNDTWVGSEINEQQVANFTVKGGLSSYFVDKFSLYEYDSVNKCYMAENINIIPQKAHDYVKIWIENGKMIALEMKMTNSADQYSIMKYSFTNYGTTVVEDIPQFTTMS